MSKSLIKNVEGIGIWVRDDATTTRRISDSFIIVAILAGICTILCEIMWITSSSYNSYWGIAMLAMIVTIFILAYPGLGFLPAYEVYSGSDHIFIIKTNDEKADQLAICKAAKEIEAQCHAFAAKRAELDRVAANCKQSF
jgi:hypothetical protein